MLTKIDLTNCDLHKRITYRHDLTKSTDPFLILTLTTLTLFAALTRSISTNYISVRNRDQLV